MDSDERDDDRDDYDRPRRRPARGTNTTVWIVLGVIAAVLLLGAIACGGLFYMGFRAAKDMVGTIGNATGAAETFLNQLQANQVSAAYQSTSQAYRAAHTPEQFAKFVAQYPMLTGHTTRAATTFNMMQVNGKQQFRIQYNLTGPNNATTCTLIMVEENGTWVVDSFTVP